MIVYKCKMCGGNLNVQEGSKTTVCEYCQTQQTVPNTDDEKKVNLYNRASYFRQNGEFDKAAEIYERMLDEDGNDAETYWSVVLCRYGIEYVEDPASHVRKPTINRTQAVSILKDADYLMALEHADPSQHTLYEKEAAEIDRIQKDILRIAKNEKAYDIFISYKEKDPEGGRTKTSVLAQDLYERLTREGYAVFFSRISLEDKIGQEFEPFIYAALTSAKIMLVVGTKPEEFNAPWVRNEWSRFFRMMREDKGKYLIPCFRDMEAYDMPDEFQVLQGQDMSKIGFEQDLIRGIGKLIAKDKGSVNVAPSKTVTNAPKEQTVLSSERMLQNAETYLTLEEYETARKSFEEVTQNYPSECEGWWGIIRAKTHEFCDLASYGDKSVAEYLNKQYYHAVDLATDHRASEMRQAYLSYRTKYAQMVAEKDKEKIEAVYAENQVSLETLEAKMKDVERAEQELEGLNKEISPLSEKLVKFEKSIRKSERTKKISFWIWITLTIVVFIFPLVIGITFTGFLGLILLACVPFAFIIWIVNKIKSKRFKREIASCLDMLDDKKEKRQGISARISTKKSIQDDLDRLNLLTYKYLTFLNLSINEIEQVIFKKDCLLKGDSIVENKENEELFDFVMHA